MSEKGQITVGIIILLLVAGGLFYWYSLTRPTQSEINSKAQEEKIITVNRDVLKDKTINQLKSMDKNGDIPIDVKSISAGKDNPFQ